MENENGAPAPPVEQPTKKPVLQLGVPIPDMQQSMQQQLETGAATFVVKPVPETRFAPHLIGTHYERHDPYDPAKITHMHAVPCESGRTIERGGRKYIIMRDGSQRRVAMEKIKKHKFGKNKK